MTLREFIKVHRAELDECIDRALNYVPKEASCYCPKSRTNHTHVNDRTRDDDERRQWILNDEGLYNWARSEGVRI